MIKVSLALLVGLMRRRAVVDSGGPAAVSAPRRSNAMQFGAQLASIVFAALVFLLVFEMVRRRHLHERYAILWLGAALVLLVLAVWTGLLKSVSISSGSRRRRTRSS